MKRIVLGTLAAAAAAAALAAPSGASAAEPAAPVCGDMRPVECAIFYLTRWDPCLLCDAEDGARRD